MPPFFSVVTPVYNPPVDVLDACLASVRDQTFADWEHCLVDDASSDPAVLATLQRWAAGDRRFRVLRRTTNGGIAAASQDAVEMATGAFLALLDHDDALEPQALARMHHAACAQPEVDYLYSDEVVVSYGGQQVGEVRKPDWSPERLRGQMYTCHLSVLRRSLVNEVGGFRPGYDGSQDYDLVLRVTERARRVVHVPRVLYRWRQVPGSVADNSQAKPYAYVAGQRAIEDHLRRVGIDADVVPIEPAGCYRLDRRPRRTPLVSIVVPTRGSSGRVWGIARTFVTDAVQSVLDRSTYPAIEVVVVADRATPAPVIDELRAMGEPVRLVWFDAPFNFSEKCNLGAAHSSGDVLLFLNGDVEVVTPGWLEAMVAIAEQTDVGAVGAKLLFADGSLQHAGHVYGKHPTHMFFRYPREHEGSFGMLRLDREVSGVTAACMLVRREVFEHAGGFTPHLAGNYNDVDVCLKLRTLGYRIVWTPQAVLYHFESQTRKATIADEEWEFIARRWGRHFVKDPYLP